MSAPNEHKPVILQKRPSALTPGTNPINHHNNNYGSTAGFDAAAAAESGSAPHAVRSQRPPLAVSSTKGVAVLSSARRDDSGGQFGDNRSCGTCPGCVVSRRGVQFMSYVTRKFSQTAAGSAAGDVLAAQLAQLAAENNSFGGGSSLQKDESGGDYGGSAPLIGTTGRRSSLSNQFRVATVGRKTYIQQVSALDIAGAATTTTSGAATTTGGGLPSHADSSSNLSAAGDNNDENNNNNNNNNQCCHGQRHHQQQQHQQHQHQQVMSLSTIVEVIRSVDMPLDNISFFSAGQDFFLPAPQAVMDEASSAEQGGSSVAFGGFDDNGDAKITSTSATARGDTATAQGNAGAPKDGGDHTSAGAGSSSSPSPQPTSASLTEIFSGSKNVLRMFIYNLIDGACFGIWSAAVLPAFMFIVANKDNSFVGYNAAVQGACQMLSAIAAAYAGDNRLCQKFVLLRLSTLFGLCAIAVTIIAVFSETKEWFWPSSALWGVYIGLSNPATESLFADSVPGGQRVAVYTYKWILQLLSYLFGYVTTVIMFERFGDKWALNEMRPILYVGLFAHVLSMVSLWFLHDDYTLEVHKMRAKKEQTVAAGRSQKKIASSGEHDEDDHRHHHHHDHDHGDGSSAANCETCQQKLSRKIQVRIVSLSKLQQVGTTVKSIADGAMRVVTTTTTTAAGGGGGGGGLGEVHRAALRSSSALNLNSNHNNTNDNDNLSGGNKSIPQRASQIISMPAIDDVAAGAGDEGAAATTASGTRQQNGEEDDAQEDEIISLADSEDLLMIEELEDDAKRDRTGDPLLADICCSWCCCCSGGGGDDDEDEDAFFNSKKQAKLPPPPPPVRRASNTDINERDETRKLLNGSARSSSSSDPEHQQQHQQQQQQQRQVEKSLPRSLKRQPLCKKMSLVPILIVSADMMQAVGGGITVRFFPLFFMTDLGVTPAGLSVVSIILCVFAALLSHGLKKFSAGVSRTHMIVVLRLLGAGLMFLMQFASGAVGGLYPMLAYFVLRSALLNSMLGISRSIIMDFCRKRHRTFFSAMESVSTLSFSGSAALGGVVADAHGYRSTFGVTAICYVIAALLVAPAGLYVDRNLKKKKKQ